MLARSFAFTLGIFVVVNLLGEWFRPGFDTNLWWVDLRFLPESGRIAVGSLATFGLLGYALRPADRGTWRAGFTSALASGLALLAFRDAAVVLQLAAAGGIRLKSGLPLSLAIALALGFLAWRAARGASPSFRRRHLLGAISLAAFWPAGFAFALMVCFGTTDYRRPAGVAVVFGARAYADGRPSDALADRVRTACDLYRAGTVRRLLFSGGPGDGEVHETEAMRRMAMSLGVRSEDIELDPWGWNTQATVRNTAATLRSREPGGVLVVSHFYHLPRVQLAYRRAGVEVRTVPAQEEALLAQLPYNMAREVAALWLYFLRS